jgi:hypothetical protein
MDARSIFPGVNWTDSGTVFREMPQQGEDFDERC